MLLFQADELRHFAERVFVAAGTESTHAAIVVDHLIIATRRRDLGQMSSAAPRSSLAR